MEIGAQGGSRAKGWKGGTWVNGGQEQKERRGVGTKRRCAGRRHGGRMEGRRITVVVEVEEGGGKEGASGNKRE